MPVNHLTLVHSPEIKAKHFPNSTGGDVYSINLCIEHDPECVGYILSEDAGTDEQGIHLCILPECRSIKYIRAVLNNFEPLLTEHLRSVQKRCAVSICRIEDTHAESLMRALGFSTTKVYIGCFMPKEDVWEQE